MGIVIMFSTLFSYCPFYVLDTSVFTFVPHGRRSTIIQHLRISRSGCVAITYATIFLITTRHGYRSDSLLKVYSLPACHWSWEEFHMTLTLQPTICYPKGLSASHASATSMQIELRHHKSDITI
jgi:hypothetical protein